MNLTFTVNQQIETVFDYLTDMQKFVSVHPVITKIVKTSENNYLVHETLKLGYLPIYFTYPVTVEQSFNDKIVTIHATIMKLAEINMSYRLSRENNLTVIHESISFKSILPVRTIMESIFTKQHTILFKNIEAL